MANLQKKNQTILEKFPYATDVEVHIVLREEALGMSPPTQDKLKAFIDLQNAKLEKKKKAQIDDDKAKEEIAALNLQIDEMKNEGRGLTVFPRNPLTGAPCMYDYQIRGMFKDSFKALLASDSEVFKKAVAGKVISKWSCDRVVDQCIFAGPRRIDFTLPEGGEIGTCDRPLGTTDPRTGQRRNTLASSETVPAGSELTLHVYVLRDDLIPLIEEVFMYGELRGIAQWRNSGKGTYDYEIISINKAGDKKSKAK